MEINELTMNLKNIRGVEEVVIKNLKEDQVDVYLVGNFGKRTSYDVICEATKKGATDFLLKTDILPIIHVNEKIPE